VLLLSSSAVFLPVLVPGTDLTTPYARDFFPTIILPFQEKPVEQISTPQLSTYILVQRFFREPDQVLLVLVERGIVKGGVQ